MRAILSTICVVAALVAATAFPSIRFIGGTVAATFERD